MRVSDALRDAVAAAYGGLVAHACTVTVAIEDETLEIAADRRRLVRALANVLANTARLSNGSCDIELSASQVDEAIVFGVREAGLDAKRVRSLTFEDAARFAPGGLGLGFWLARRVVLAHGGKFWVESGAAGGTTVKLALPRFGPVHGRPPAKAPLDANGAVRSA